MDYYSKWSEFIGTNEINRDRMTTELDKIFDRLEYPNTLVSDNGTQLVSQKTTNFLRTKGIKPKREPLYDSNQDGCVERFNRVISEKLKDLNNSVETSRKPLKEFCSITEVHHIRLQGYLPSKQARLENEGRTDPPPSKTTEGPGKKITREQVHQRQDTWIKKVESKKSPFYEIFQ